MTTFEKICYIKDNELFHISNGLLQPITLEEVEEYKGKITLMLDDTFFFYVGMDNVSVTGKKLRSVANNYLNILFPNGLVGSFGVFQGKGYTFIYVISQELMKLIDEYPNLFSIAKRITTPFVELSSRYSDFVFSDGVKAYKKENNNILSTDELPTLTLNDLISDISSITTNISLPNVKKNNIVKIPFLMPIASIVFIYLVFIIGNIIQLNSLSNINERYNSMLNYVYHSVGINTEKDPYGQLLSKSGLAKKSFNGKRILAILSDLETIGKDTATFNTFSVRDKSVRADGVTDDFAKIESLKKKAEQVLQQSVNLDDTKKTNDGVTFVMRYEQK